MATNSNNPDSVMSAADQERIQYYRDVYNNATDQATRDAAHKAAEDIRQSYGYSGGADGSQYITEGVEKSAGTYYDEGLSTADQRAVDEARLEYYLAEARGDQAGMEAAHAKAEAVREGYGYSGGGDGSDYIKLQQAATAPTISGTSVSGVTATQPKYDAEELLAKWKEDMPQVDTDELVKQWKDLIPDVGQAKSDQKALLDQWKAALLEQNNNQIDYGVAKAITELERALEDAQPQFKEQQESVAKDEMQARDNAALYAEARGDKGGIGEEQYSSIMNTAAQNRLAIQQAQTKLSTDTQRQIADLRAQGEFEKADAALEISQQYLSQLMALEQWALEYGLTTAQFQASLDQWAANYKLAMAEFTTGLDQWAANYDMGYAQWQTGVDQWNKEFQLAQEQWNKEFQLAQQQYQTSVDQWQKEFDTAKDQWQQSFDYGKEQDEQDRQAGAASTLLNAGVASLSDAQLSAIGLTREQASAVVVAVQQTNDTDKLANAASILINAGVDDINEAQLKAIGLSAEQASKLVKAVQAQQENELNLEWAKLNDKDGGSDGDTPVEDMDANQIYGYLFQSGFKPGATKKENAAVVEEIKADLIGQGVSASAAETYAGVYLDSKYEDLNTAQLASTIPEDIREGLMRNFPGGVITGEKRWQSWVDKYGEEAMRAAGFTPEQKTEGSAATPSNSYGTSYSTAWSQARKMHDAGKSEAEIMAYLDTFSETRLTDEGLAYIMNSLNLGGYRTGAQ